MADISPSDAIVIGSGPNGLAAAIVLAQAGLSVTVIEGASTLGGGARSAELTLPGFLHDLCSAVHPLAISSPFFRTLPLSQHGLEWIHPPAPLAHPLDDGTAVMLERSLDSTADSLGPDRDTYRELLSPLVENWNDFVRDLLAPMRLPENPLALVRFGLNAIRPARSLAQSKFSGQRTRALFAGMAAHSILPLNWLASAAFGLVLGAAGHAGGWPIPKGGSQQISNALASYFRSLGGSIILNLPVRSLDELPPARAVLCDIGPPTLLRIAGTRLPESFRRKLMRYRYGPGAFKVDYALSVPIPWKSRECARAATVHLGATLEEITASERAPWKGAVAERPFVLLVQPTLFDSTRAPAGKHIAWAYCHVPNACSIDMLERIEAQIERFAPGFRDIVLARSIMPPSALEAYNPNLVGGDVNGGAPHLPQLFTRPTSRLYATTVKGLYLCSASTPPGGGVHGMCGYYAAQLALLEVFGKRREQLS